jgi:hypothetical protein
VSLRVLGKADTNVDEPRRGNVDIQSTDQTAHPADVRSMTVMTDTVVTVVRADLDVDPTTIEGLPRRRTWSFPAEAGVAVASTTSLRRRACADAGDSGGHGLAHSPRTGHHAPLAAYHHQRNPHLDRHGGQGIELISRGVDHCCGCAAGPTTHPQLIVMRPGMRLVR